MVEAIYREIVFYGKSGSNLYMRDTPIETIYFGGGTPSVLSTTDISLLIETVQQNFEIVNNPEITLEANPDDLTKEYCDELKSAGINRLSIGIQSFYEEHLVWMNRSHNAEQASNCVQIAIDSGINHISMDLIYGFPGLSDEQWTSNLEKASALQINHLSCYSLTVEERTPLKKLIDTGKYVAPDEDMSANQFSTLMSWAKNNDWEHYEISNFCRGGAYSKHNTAYWQQKKYLGIGPSAHSYNGLERRWNVKDNHAYIQSWILNIPPTESEILTKTEKLNDLILTSLRTKWGLKIDKANDIAGIDFYEENKDLIELYISMDLITYNDKLIKLTDSGKLFSDSISAEFFY